MLRPFTLLIKPASADCNLRCEYCFYLEHMGFYPETRTHRMSAQVLEQLVRSYMRTPQPEYSFGWQGGEPTLMGLEFYKRAVALQQQYGMPGARVGNGMQTNGTLIDDAMAAFFARYNFLVGVSLDGPPEIHDKHRVKAGGGGSHAEVLRGIGKLRAHHAEFNILTLVNEANVRRGAEVYRYLVDQGFLYHQYIPCVEPDSYHNLLPFSISGPEWGEFLCTVFDVWYARDTRRVSIRLFDSILLYLLDGVRNICHFGTNCCQYFVVEHNGDVYPCDFFVEKPLWLGNVMEDSWAALQSSPVYRSFGARKRQWASACDACEFVDLCQGDCLKHRLCADGGDPRRLSLLCEGWKMFYSHTLPRFRELAARVARERAAFSGPGEAGAGAGPPGRNDPCPCGSGKKYKHCCGRKGRRNASME